jgi:putative toxin-antitoxin system antitoxin component (TIGR02293 family)
MATEKQSSPLSKTEDIISGHTRDWIANCLEKVPSKQGAKLRNDWISIESQIARARLQAGQMPEKSRERLQRQVIAFLYELELTNSGEREHLRHITDLLGGPKVIGKYPSDPLAAHELLAQGLPNVAVMHLLGGMSTLAQETVEYAIGMSARTRQRREKHPTELLNQDQAGRTWKFADILARATTVFGSRTAAEQWLAEPATGLDQRRPIDLLSTPAGLELVEDFLGRIEYGVYA